MGGGIKGVEKSPSFLFLLNLTCTAQCSHDAHRGQGHVRWFEWVLQGGGGAREVCRVLLSGSQPSATLTASLLLLTSLPSNVNHPDTAPGFNGRGVSPAAGVAARRLAALVASGGDDTSPQPSRGARLARRRGAVACAVARARTVMWRTADRTSSPAVSMVGGRVAPAPPCGGVRGYVRARARSVGVR